MPYLKWTSSNLSNCRVLPRNKKCLSLRPKMLDLGVFNQKCLILVILYKTFRKPIVIFETSILNFVYLQNFAKKNKMFNWGPKMLDLDIFGLEFKNNILISDIIILKFVKLQSFSEKQKCLNLESTMALLGIFDQKCLIWVFLVENFRNTNIIFKISNLKFV